MSNRNPNPHRIAKLIPAHKLRMAMNCLHSATVSKDVERAAVASASPERAQRTSLGRVVHMMMDGKGRSAIVESLKARAPELDGEVLEALVVKAEKMAERKKARMEQGKDIRTEEDVFYFDRETGWTIVARPDRVEVFQDEQGDYVLVKDWKLDVKVRRRHIESVKLFGTILRVLMAAKSPDVRIKLEVESLDDGEPWSQWMGPLHETVTELSRIQDTLRAIDEAKGSDRVAPRTTGGHCYGCALREQCKQGRKFIARDQEGRRPAALPAPAREPERIAA